MKNRIPESYQASRSKRVVDLSNEGAATSENSGRAERQGKVRREGEVNVFQQVSFSMHKHKHLVCPLCINADGYTSVVGRGYIGLSTGYKTTVNHV